MILGLILICSFQLCLTYKPIDNKKFCQDLQPTHDFDEESILGMWFIHEYIYHRDSTIKTEVNSYCPIVHIRKIEDYINGGLINRNLVS